MNPPAAARLAIAGLTVLWLIRTLGAFHLWVFTRNYPVGVAVILSFLAACCLSLFFVTFFPKRFSKTV